MLRIEQVIQQRELLLAALDPDEASERQSVWLLAQQATIAPKLYEACKALMRLQHAQFVGSWEGSPENRETIVEQARAVIAEADKK